jgi:hypothetical protein
MQEPTLNRYIPPTEADLEDQRRSLERRRAELADRRAAEAPRRRAVLATGPALRDIAAAVECRCSCHPRPAEFTLHDGGADCPCQHTEEERRAAWDELFGILADRVDEDPARPSLREMLAERAETLGVEIRDVLDAAPFVISGVVDGRGFYLRERHGSWALVVAGDDDPAADVWRAPRTDPSITVATGDEADLVVDGAFSATMALDLAVDAVRLFELRRRCGHRTAGRFCPTCGVEMRRAEAWRHPQ